MVNSLIHSAGRVSAADEEALHKFFRPSLRKIKQRLRELGAMRYDLMLPETKCMPHILRAGEKLEGIVYGRYVHADTGLVGRGALVATSQRLILIDKKPLFMKYEEMSYDTVSAITTTKVPLATTINLYNRTGAISLRTFNERCAEGFVAAVENRTVQRRPAQINTQQ